MHIHFVSALWVLDSQPYGYGMVSPMGTGWSALWVRDDQPYGYRMVSPMGTGWSALWVRDGQPYGYGMVSPMGTGWSALWVRDGQPYGYVVGVLPHSLIGVNCPSFGRTVLLDHLSFCTSLGH